MGDGATFAGVVAAAELLEVAADKSVVKCRVVELIAQRGLRLPTEFALDLLSRAGRAKVGDARLEDPRWRRPRLDHQLFESFLFSFVEAAVVVKLEMAEVGALHGYGATAVEVAVDLGVLDSLRFKVGMRVSFAGLEDAEELLFRETPKCTVVVDDVVAGPDAHIAILPADHGTRDGAWVAERT
jgi:hypothetical protein